MYDQLEFQDCVNLSSATLNVNWGFMPRPGQHFDIIKHDSRVGQFGTINIPPIPGLIFTIDYSNQNVTRILVTCEEDCSITRLKPKVFLQGPYEMIADSMKVATSRPIPIKCPYDTLVSRTQIPPSMVDWVKIEVYDSLLVRDTSICACLYSDGRVLNTFDSLIIVNNASIGNKAIIKISHLNHLAVKTKLLSLPFGSTLELDCTDTTQVFTSTNLSPITVQNATQPMYQAPNGKFALWAGDVNGNSEIKFQGSGNDRAIILSLLGGNITNTQNGYLKEDVNLNGEVKYQGSGNDRTMMLQNIGGDITKTLKAHVE